MFLDIGANVGFYSLLHASKSLVTGTWAFEPNPKPRGALEKSVVSNKFESLIKVFPYALSDSDGQASFTFEEGVSGSGHISSKDEGGEIEVEIRAFSGLWEEAGEPKVSIIKIDVEGHEWQVLQAMKVMLERDHPKIVIELVDDQLERFDSSAEQIKQYLSGLGYKIVGGYELNSFFEYSE